MELVAEPGTLYVCMRAVTELVEGDSSRKIVEIICRTSLLKSESSCIRIERVFKVHNTQRTLARFEEYRDAVKARAAAGGAGQQPMAMGAKNSNNSTNRHPRCTADGNELLRFHCATLACSLGLNGATHLCDAAGGCAACGIIRDGFSRSAGDGGVLTMATSGRAHDAVPVPAAEGGLGEEAERQQRRAMLVCRVIAGRVKRPKEEEQAASVEADADADAEGEEEEEYDSVAGSAGVYSNLEELLVFSPRAILPCFVVVYKA